MSKKPLTSIILMLCYAVLATITLIGGLYFIQTQKKTLEKETIRLETEAKLIVPQLQGDQILAKMQIEEFDPTIQIIQAYDGQQALEILDTLEQEPDIILLDINMPTMNGHEFLEEYDKRDNNSVVVVMLTSSNQEKDRDKIIKYDFVKKYFVKLLNESHMEAIQKL